MFNKIDWVDVLCVVAFACVMGMSFAECMTP